MFLLTIIYFLCKVSVQIIVNIFVVLLSYYVIIRVLYIFLTEVLWQIYEYFLSVIACLFYFIDIFQRAKLLNFKKCSVSVFSFLICVVFISFKISFPISNVWIFSPVFSYRSMKILAFTFRPIIHFKLILVYSISEELTFTFFHIDIQLF